MIYEIQHGSENTNKIRDWYGNIYVTIHCKANLTLNGVNITKPFTHSHKTVVIGTETLVLRRSCTNAIVAVACT